MSEKDHEESRADNARAEEPRKGSSRRAFLRQVGGVATTVAAGAPTAGAGHAVAVDTYGIGTGGSGATMARCWNEAFEGFSFTKFDGTRIAGVGKNT